MSSHEGRILILSSVVTDATLVCEMLEHEFREISTSTNAARFTADFDRVQPQVMIFALKSISESERHYLNLFRKNASAIPSSYRTILLCQKSDVSRAYELCKLNYFHDYVMFWPMVHDAPRLAMAVHLALRALAHTKMELNISPLIAQARRITVLEDQLEKQLAAGASRIEEVERSLKLARAQLTFGINGLAEHVVELTPREPGTSGAERVQSEVRRFADEAVWPSFDAIDESQGATAKWLGGVRTALAEPIDAARSLSRKLSQLPPTLLIVDDDEFMRNLLARVLVGARYAVVTVGSGHEALTTLSKKLPDLILMDVDLPDISGIEVTRRLKRNGDYAAIPIIMLTGHGEKDMVVNSRGAGADDYVVKPFEREVLLEKVSRRLIRPSA